MPTNADPPNTPFAPSLTTTYAKHAHTQNGGPNLDIYFPKTSTGTPDSPRPAPLVLFVHGGGFAMGASVAVPFRQVRWLCERGIAVASVGYRLLPHVGLAEQRQDMLDAYAYVTRGEGLNAALGAAGANWTVDPTRVAAWGASAGGALVLLLAADLESNELGVDTTGLPPLRALVPNYPLVDFAPLPQKTPEDLKRALQEGAELGLGRLFSILLSEDCTTNQMWVDTSTPADDLPVREAFMRQAFSKGLMLPLLFPKGGPYTSHAPLERVSGAFPPTYILVAGEDNIIPPASLYALNDKLNKAGVESSIVECKGMPHGDLECLPHQPVWPEGSDWWEEGVLPTLEFLLGHLH